MNKNNLKSICIIGNGLQGGGIERAFTSLANYLIKKGLKVSVIVLFKTDHFYTLDSDIIFYEPKIERKKIPKYIYALKMIPFIRQSLRAINPDVILSYGEWFNPFVILSTRGLQYPLFISDRMSPDLKLGLFNTITKKISYRFADGIIAQTNFAKKEIIKKTGAKNITTIPNVLNIFNYPVTIKKNQIVVVGRLSVQKNHQLLIRAFAKINYPNWQLHIIGDGDKKNSLLDLVINLNISDRVIFYGHLKDFTDILAESQIFVLPSLSEGFPNALIEAMSVPLACISTNCTPGLQDIIDNGVNGLIVEQNNEAKMTEAIEKLISDPDLRNNLAKEAFKIRDNLSLDKIVDKYVEFLQSGIK